MGNNKNYWYNSEEGKLYREDHSRREIVTSSDEIGKLCEQLQKLKVDKSILTLIYKGEEVGRAQCNHDYGTQGIYEIGATMTQRSISSNQREEKSMKFEEVLPLVKDGEKAFRLSWNGNERPPKVNSYPNHEPTERMEYVEDTGLVYVRLSDGSVAVADGCDYELLSNQEKWSINTNGYPCFTKYPEKTTVTMHNYIMGRLPNLSVDHINGNTLDNRRVNLRYATVKQNSGNKKAKKGTSVYKGVSYDSSRRKWISSIQIEGKTKHIGRYESEVEGAKAYDDKSYEVYGSFAKLNFPDRDLEPRMFVVFQKGYPEGIPCNKQTAEAWGLNEGDLFKVQPYMQIKNANGTHAMWVPSINDILADDWEIMG